MRDIIDLFNILKLFELNIIIRKTILYISITIYVCLIMLIVTVAENETSCIHYLTILLKQTRYKYKSNNKH